MRAAWRGDHSPEAVTILRSKPGRMIVLAPKSALGVLMMIGVEPPHEPGGPRFAAVRFNLYERSGALAPPLKTEWDARLAELFP